MNNLKKYFPRPLWFWNDKPTKSSIEEIMYNSLTKSNYGGFGILSYDACNVEYLSEEYFELFSYVLETAKKLDQKICLYDEFWFPSGSAGGLLKKNFPDSCAKKLSYKEIACIKDVPIKVESPRGILLSATVFNQKSKAITSVRDKIKNNFLEFVPTSSDEKLLIFSCEKTAWDRVDYLSPEAVGDFIKTTHEEFFKRFAEYFGNVIDSSFYDEPQFYGADGAMWTPEFNRKFKQKHGFEPDLLYPSLYNDTGVNTYHNRNLLLGFRAELYSLGFPKVLQDWCAKHNISLMGHVDQEEILNCSGMTGDLMLSFKHQEIPGIDEVFMPRRAKKAYKIVTSAANNFDKAIVMTECYGAMAELSHKTMILEAIEQYAKGINMFVPHAVWQNADEEKVFFRQELSYRTHAYAEFLPKLNNMCALLSMHLQGGRHISQIGVLYPIESLHSQYNFAKVADPYLGGEVTDFTDYQDIAEYIYSECNQDYTFIHPEILDEKCTVEESTIRLNNVVNYEEYKVIVVPGQIMIKVENLKKLVEFYENGGKLIFTSKLAEYAYNASQKAEIDELYNKLFSNHNGSYSENSNKNGGKVWFVPLNERNKIKDILNKIDFDFKFNICKTDLMYLRKNVNGKDTIFVANCGTDIKNAVMRIRGTRDYIAICPLTLDETVLDILCENGNTIINFSLNESDSLLLVER